MSKLKKMTEDEFNDLIRELDYDGRDAFVEVDFSNYDLTELDLQSIINKFVRCNYSPTFNNISQIQNFVLKYH